MSGVLFYLPNARQLSVSGGILAGWKAQFYRTQTTTPTPVYADGDLQTELDNPVVADSTGTMAPIYLDPDVVYRVQIYTAANVLLDDVDPFDPSRGSSSGGGMQLFGIALDHSETNTAGGHAYGAQFDIPAAFSAGGESAMRVEAYGTITISGTHNVLLGVYDDANVAIVDTVMVSLSGTDLPFTIKALFTFDDDDPDVMRGSMILTLGGVNDAGTVTSVTVRPVVVDAVDIAAQLRIGLFSLAGGDTLDLFQATAELLGEVA